ncbi:hypothetical protein [Sulfuriflexus mobilis]|uniref:hypothetical protein n=1 Tax=Sulfuriflexus mobilis TaxID=1811807 RepID=UPI000F847C41|nr:hypothetical protein [Sulfuriflexus mobilis]
MKKEFSILKDRPEVPITLTRDSVAAGDDIDAPHEKKIKIKSFTDPVVLAREASTSYLPNVAGSGHSWICVLNKIEIAEIKTNEIQPLINEAEYSDKNNIHFIYKSARY